MQQNSKSKAVDYLRYYPFFFTVLYIIILFQYSFSSLEGIFYDLRIKYDFGTGFNDNIVLITMDEESDEFLGEKYPYTYATHERLLKRLFRDRPMIINYLVTMSEPEMESGKRSLRQLKRTIYDYMDSGGNFRFGSKLDDTWGEHIPPQELRDIGYSLSLVNIDNAVFAKDDLSRRMILDVSGESSLHLWTANIYRSLMGKEKLDANLIQGAYYDGKADATFAMFRYYTSPLETRKRIRRIPVHRVVVGNFPKGFFTGKIVLLGPNYISNPADYVLTPFNSDEYKTSKLTLHAELIQALVQGKTVFPLPISVSYVLAAIIAMALSFVISRVRPTRGLLVTVFVLFGVAGLSYIIFLVFGIWIYMAHLILAVFGVYYTWVPFRAIAEYQRRYAIQEETVLLKKVEHLKQNFISLMSHDLKTPVAKIAGMADVLLRPNMENKVLSKGLQTIIDSTKELNNFITSILDLTKIESRNLNINMVSKDINQIIEGVVDNLKYEASNKDMVIESSLSPLYPIEVDVILMKRVISNLVENAIKYSGANSKVLITTWDDEEWVYLQIKDDGIGIPREALAHIFDRFYRVKNDASHSIKGSGLGLYLVKYFVELHGGSIVAESIQGQGTTFTVKLKNK